MSELGSSRRWATLIALVGLLLAAAPALAAGFPAQEPPPQLRPVQIVVLVDESGSLQPQDVDAERDAARVIVQGETSPESTVSVVGFASSDAPGQAPVEVVCRPTKPDTPQNRQYLADCVGKLRGRAPTEGNGTDHLTVLRQALDHLKAPDAAGQSKIVFLLTDGVLDVSNSPAYGNNPADRNAAARDQLPGLLDQLRQAGVQVWPLGFGKADKAQLDGFATAAAQDRCGFRTPQPTARVIASSADLLGAIGDAFSAARCVSVGQSGSGQLPAGGSVKLSVEIPAIATEGSILVLKRDPRVVVDYLDPAGTPVPANGTLGTSRFELTGQGSPAEQMRIVNPTPGRWTLRLSAPPGVPAQDVAAIASFQGAIRALISCSPPAPRPGSPVEITMQLRGVRAAITDPAQLRGLTFVAGLSGDGFAPVPPAELHDREGNGQYRGQLTVPDAATGRLDFTGSVSGIGVSEDKRTYSTQIQTRAPGVQAVLHLGGAGTGVIPGTSLEGTANATNSTGQPRTLRVEVTDLSPGAVIAVEPALLTVPASGQAVLPFTVRFDPATVLGPNEGRLRLVDTSDGAVIADLLFMRDVELWYVHYWWLLVSLGTLLAAALAGIITAALRRSRRRSAGRDIHGIRIELRRHGQVVESLAARQHGEEFRFGVRRGESAAETGLTTGSGGDRYRVRRGPGGLILTGLAGEPIELAPGGVMDLGAGLELVVRNRPGAAQPARSARRPPAGGGRSGAPRPAYRPDPYSIGESGNRAAREHDPYDNTP